MKKISTFILLCIAGTLSAHAQKKLNALLQYDKNFERYEVLVKPNFSEDKFTWGPSQITVVLPTNILVEKINVRNIDGGAWKDNSTIYAPQAKPDASFHGFSSIGEKTNLVEDHETVLFYFTLPKEINPGDVELFDNEKDPKSTDIGMMGGDFRNTIVDISGKDYFGKIHTKEKVNLPQTEPKTDLDATVFPNIVTDKKFRLNLMGVEDSDGDILMIITDETGREMKRQKASKSILEKQVISLSSDNISLNNLIVKFITKKGSISKRVLVEN